MAEGGDLTVALLRDHLQGYSEYVEDTCVLRIDCEEMRNRSLRSLTATLFCWIL